MALQEGIESPVLILDASGIAHACKHTLGTLSYEDQSTGVLFGMFLSIQKLAKRFRTRKFAFAWDSKKSFRREKFSGYKNRKSKELTEEEKDINRSFAIQYNLLRTKLIPKFGFTNSFIQTGYEADDIIAQLAMSICRPEVIDEDSSYKAIIVSRDNDLLQLLQYADVYDPISQKLMTEKKFQAEWGFSSDKWSALKAIAGCSSDTVPGIPGIGEKTAAKYIRNELDANSKAFDNIHRGKRNIEFYYELVNLPMEGTNQFEFKNVDVHRSNDFQDMCNKYGFMHFLKMKEYNWWKNHFEMI